MYSTMPKRLQTRQWIRQFLHMILLPMRLPMQQNLWGFLIIRMLFILQKKVLLLLRVEPMGMLSLMLHGHTMTYGLIRVSTAGILMGRGVPMQFSGMPIRAAALTILLQQRLLLVRRWGWHGEATAPILLGVHILLASKEEIWQTGLKLISMSQGPQKSIRFMVRMSPFFLREN